MLKSDYDAAKEGDNLQESFKTGSMLIGGGLTWTKLIIKEKMGYVCEKN